MFTNFVYFSRWIIRGSSRCARHLHILIIHSCHLLSVNLFDVYIHYSLLYDLYWLFGGGVAFKYLKLCLMARWLHRGFGPFLLFVSPLLGHWELLRFSLRQLVSVLVQRPRRISGLFFVRRSSTLFYLNQS